MKRSVSHLDVLKDLVRDVKVDLIGCTIRSSIFMEIFVSLNMALVAVCIMCNHKRIE
jgi:hypothetical protein